MATDATGTPTTKGIPKFNTAVDSPTGKGVNAMMDSIDTLLDSYQQNPAGIATGEASVWNGSAWARSSVTRLTTVRPQDLGQDGAVTGQPLVWDGSKWAPGSTVLDRLVTDATFASSTAENTLYTKTVAANTLGSTRFIRLTLWGLASTNAGTDTDRLRVKWGGTTVVDTGAVQINSGGGISGRAWKMMVYIQADNATNAQTIETDMLLTYSAANPTTGTGGIGNNAWGFNIKNTDTKDTTSAQDVVLTWQHGTNSANCSVTIHSAIMELI